MEESYLEQYKKKIEDSAIPLYQVMGNRIFSEKFDCDPELVYKYCLENNMTWESVLNFEFDPDVMY